MDLGAKYDAYKVIQAIQDLQGVRETFLRPT
jgi:hypothetical protein